MKEEYEKSLRRNDNTNKSNKLEMVQDKPAETIKVADHLAKTSTPAKQ